MLTKLQHLLTKLAEEGAEVAQIALKTQQFGPDEVMPGQPLTNFQRCHLELDDIAAVVELLNANHAFGYTQSRERIEAKKMKMAKYLAFSAALGMAENEVACSTHPMAEKKECDCEACRPITLSDMRFNVCPICGNKRCPHARDHRNACTGSNEPGQIGSAEQQEGGAA